MHIQQAVIQAQQKIHFSLKGNVHNNIIYPLPLRKEDIDWATKSMQYEVEGSRPRGRPKRTWKEDVQKDCQARKLKREDAIDRSKWKKLIKVV